MHFLHGLLLRVCLPTTVLGGLVAVRSPPLHDVPLTPVVYERSIFPAISLGRYELATSRQDDVLFDLTSNVAQGGPAGIKVTCLDCRTWGAAVVSTVQASQDGDLIGNIINFFKDPEKSIVDAFSIDLKLQLDNVGGHFEFDINAMAALSYAIPIYQSLTPIGGKIGNDISIGVVFSIELVFSVTAGIDLTAGFEFSFPEDTYIIVDSLTGEIKEDGFLDGKVNPLPIIVQSGNATFKAALKASLQAGTSVELFGTGFDFQLGVFANVIEYVATISSTESCALSVTQLLDVNLGAYAKNVLKFNFVSIGGSPPFITTILTVPLPSFCLIEGPLPRVTSTAYIATSVSASSTISPPEIPAATPIRAIFLEKGTPTSTVVPLFIISTTLKALPSAGTSLPYANATIPAHFTNATTTATSSLPLVTSTVYQTNTITLCQCAEPLINCPTSLTSELVITSTKVLYTTICEAGAILPTTLPASLSSTKANPTAKTFSPLPHSSSANIKASSSTASLHLIPLATPIVEKVYEPVFDRPVYTMPTLGSLTVGGANVKNVKLEDATGSPSQPAATGIIPTSAFTSVSGVASQSGRLPASSSGGSGTLEFSSSATSLLDGAMSRFSVMTGALAALAGVMVFQ